MNIRPTGNRLLVEHTPVETQTSSGIFLPPVARSQSQHATVIALGKDCDKNLNVGDQLLLDEARYDRTVVKIDGKDLRLIYDHEILAIMR